MTEPKKVQIIRSHQKLSEYVYDRDEKVSPSSSYEELLLSQQDYYAVGWRRLHLIQSLSLKENWPITMGNAAMSFSSGLIGGLITNRMARNLSLHITLSTLPSSGACFFALTLAHLSSYYYLVLRPMFSDDPFLCPTCLEIRSFTLASMIPPIMGTSIAVLANLSAILMNKTITLPRFNPKAYPEWKHFFQKHAFRGMSRRYFVAYPLVNGFLASVVFLGQNYYWRNNIRNRLEILEKESRPVKESRKANRLFGPIQDLFTKIMKSKTRSD